MFFCFVCVFGLGFLCVCCLVGFAIGGITSESKVGFHDNHKLWTSGRVAKDEEKKTNAFILTRHAGYFQPNVIVFFACHTLDRIYFRDEEHAMPVNDRFLI